MRPLTLTLKGFRSHVNETSFSFESRTLVAIVGPTGAGKSTILDGISYALYAKTPRERQSSRNLISTRTKKAALTYRFSIGDDTYQINRSIPAASDDHMIEIGTGDRVVGSTAITARVEELLGLDFDGFASSVLLAQGRFDLFLKATTKERTGILKGIFRIERIDDLRKAAVGRRDAVDDELNKIEGERRQIPDDAADRLEAARSDVSQLAERITSLQKAMPEEARLLEQEKHAATEVADAEREIAVLSESMTRLPSSAVLEELAEEEAACAVSTKEATSTLESCSKEADKAATELKRLQKKFGDVKVLHSARATAESVKSLEDELSGLDTELESLMGSIGTLDEEVDRARTSESDAKEKLASALAVVDELKRVHAAHGLRTHLVTGKPCPVCEQTVATIPKTKKVGDLDKAESAVVAAERMLGDARAAVGDVEKRAVAERQRLKSTIATHDKATAKLTQARADVEEVVGKATDPLAEIEGRLATLDDAATTSDRARQSREDAQKVLSGCVERKQALDDQRRKHAEVLIQLAVKLEVDAPSIDDPAASLIEKVHAMSDRASTRGEQLRARIDDVAVKVKETAEALAVLREKAGVESSFVEALSKAQADRAVKQHVIEDLTSKLARSKELDDHEKEHRTKRALFHQLADDLTDRHFVNFLLEDRRRLLSELASERLHEMTKRYRFTDDGEFNIVDELEGDVERGTDTLSGGETFLASLALALGLAETAARHGGRLQSFFLDEGFDSLDAEMLDQALDGIERIVTSDRLIALVSHVPALAARVEDRIVLGKDAEGSSIVLEGASG